MSFLQVRKLENRYLEGHSPKTRSLRSRSQNENVAIYVGFLADDNPKLPPLLFPSCAQFSQNTFQVSQNAVPKMYLCANALTNRILLLSQ
jgi:hypothetical protein